MKKKYWTLLIVGVLVVALVIVLASCGNFSLKDKDLDEDEEMEDLVRTEVLVAGIEDRKLQGVDDAAHGVDDATGQEPAKG